MNCLSRTDVLFLAGGKGTRLSSLFPDLPKCLVPVRGRAFLDYLLEWVHSFGARRVILALGHRSEAVLRYLKTISTRSLEVIGVVEPEPRGTGGALSYALPELRWTTALVVNGDSLAAADPCELLSFHRTTRADISLLASHVSDVSRYGALQMEEGGRIVSFTEKSRARGEGYVNCGVYCIERFAIETIPKGRFVSLECELLPTTRNLFALRGQYRFLDVGTPESYATAEEFVRELNS